MRPIPALPLVLLVSACRQPVPVDTSSAKFIPRELAVQKLKELLPTADTLGSTVPKTSIWTRDEVKEWKVDDKGVEYVVPGKEPYRFTFAEITSTRLDRVTVYYQVRIFTPAQPNPKKDHFHFSWRSEESARTVMELLEAMTRKP